MAKTVLVNDSAQAEGSRQSYAAVPPEAMPVQLAVADLNLASITLLADAAGTINTLLARLRAAGILAP